MNAVVLSVGFIPLVDAAPLIAAQEMGFAAEEGLALDLVRAPSWSSLRDMLVFGRVEAARHFFAIAEVQGRVAGLADGLAEGQIVAAGAVLVEIDRTDYELTIQKTEANIAAAEAQLAELDRQEANTRASLEVETRTAEVTQAEYDRIAELVVQAVRCRSGRCDP